MQERMRELVTADRQSAGGSRDEGFGMITDMTECMQKAGVGVYRAPGWTGGGRGLEWRSRWQDGEQLPSGGGGLSGGTKAVVEVSADRAGHLRRGSSGVSGIGQDKMVPTSDSGVKPTGRGQQRTKGQSKQTVSCTKGDNAAQQQGEDMPVHGPGDREGDDSGNLRVPGCQAEGRNSLWRRWDDRHKERNEKGGPTYDCGRWADYARVDGG